MPPLKRGGFLHTSPLSGYPICKSKERMITMQKKPFDPNEERGPLFPVEEMSTMSGTDMTGLIPAGLDSRAELESYEEMYDFLPKMTDPDQM